MNRPAMVELRVRAEAFDDERFSLGVVRASVDQVVQYANRAAKDMTEGQLVVGQPLSRLNLDSDSRNALRQALETRYGEHGGSGYDLKIGSLERDTTVRTHVEAVPEYDANGELVGSIAFVLDRSVDTVATAIHEIMDMAATPQELLTNLTVILRDVLSFDSLMVSAISRGGDHLRNFFESPEAPEPPTPYRWWAMPSFVRKMLKDFVEGPLDLDDLFSQPDFAQLKEMDPALQHFVERDFQHSLRLRVKSRGEQVAIVSLLRRRGAPPFVAADVDRCIRVRLLEAVNWALFLDAEDQQRFTLELIDRLTAASDDPSAMRQHLVDALWKRFKWEHVSLFSVEPDRGLLRMACQAQDAPALLPPGYTQNIDRRGSLLSKALLSQTIVNAPRVASSKDHEPAAPGLRSELVLPLPGKETRWLLNIESSDESAFADEERLAIELPLRVAGLAIERAEAEALRSAVFDHMADVFIRTNEINCIIEVNRACETQLRMPREDLLNRFLPSFVVLEEDDTDGDESLGWASPKARISKGQDHPSDLLNTDQRMSGILRLRRGDGTQVNMLVSTARLPGQFGGKIFVASDLSEQEYRDRIDALLPRFRQLTSEIRVPLALASSFLGKADEGRDPQQMVRAAIEQIGKADVSLERVMRVAAATEDARLHTTAFELRQLVTAATEKLPRDIADLLSVTARGDDVLVDAAFKELLHCVQSLLAYLLRVREGDESIELKLGQLSGSRAFLSLRLRRADTAVPRALEDDEELRRDVAPVVDALLRRMGGEFKSDSERERYALLVRLADGGAEPLTVGIAVGDRRGH